MRFSRRRRLSAMLLRNAMQLFKLQRFFHPRYRTRHIICLNWVPLMLVDLCRPAVLRLPDAEISRAGWLRQRHVAERQLGMG
jgi:hypothetical protein